MLSNTFIFVGRSGSGKGTQAELLEKYLKREKPGLETLYLQTGRHFREFLKKDSHTNELVQKLISEGGLLPEFLPIWAWTDFLIENFTGGEDLIFDGVTRQPDEAPVLEGALKFYGIRDPRVIAINVGDEWAMRRLKDRGRYDDTDQEIKKRLAWYETAAVVAIEYFRKTKYFHVYDINGEQTIEEVHNEIIHKVFNNLESSILNPKSTDGDF